MSGAHRTGKTTLAQAFAQQKDIPFVRTSATEVFKMLGLDPSKEYPIEERIAIQEAILAAFEAQYADATRRTPLWISDRTPIDLASYMLADIQRETVARQPALGELVADYKLRCIESANRWFSVIVLVQPGIATRDEVGKALACPAFMEHLNDLQHGLMKDERAAFKNFYIPRQYTALDDRIACVSSAVGKSLLAHQALMETIGTVMH